MNYQLVTQVTTYTTQPTKDMHIHDLGAIQIRNCNSEVAADLRLTPQGHSDWFCLFTFISINLSLS